MKTNEIRKQLYIKKLDELKNITVDEKIKLIFKKEKPRKDENGVIQRDEFGNELKEDKYITVLLPKRYDMYNSQMATFKLSTSKLSKIDKYLEISNDLFILAIDEFIESESGYKLEGFIGVVCNIDKYNPLKASSFIELPDFFKSKKCIINVKNTDNQCFYGH